MAVGASVLAESLSSPAGFWQQQAIETRDKRKNCVKYLIIKNYFSEGIFSRVMTFEEAITFFQYAVVLRE